MGNPDSGPNSDPPMRIGRYAVKRELGRGGMGVVYLAHDAELERDVAIKTLPGVDETNPDRLRRFEREAKVLAAINHPNIATIYSIEKTDDGLRFIVLEYIEGETLGRVLKKNAVNLRQAIELCIQTAKAIAAAHAKGIVHRDIKPGNVMVTTDMTVKVLDFGLSMREPTGASDIDVTRTVQTMPGQVMGTPGYMAPEQARGKPVDKRADIWSFGCILFQTLAGQPAFQGDTSTDIIASTLHNEPTWTKLPASTPRNMRELLQRMLAKNADDRLDEMTIAVKVLTDSLHRFSATGSVTAAHYGNFEAVKELDSSTHASIWEVKPTSHTDEAGEDGEAPSSVRYIAKIVEPPSVNLAPDQTMRLLDTFRSGTAVQKKLADAAKSSHWAKILDHGQFPGGAFYITERVDHTLSQLLHRGDRPTASEVHSIIQGVVAALVELDQMFQRPHGNLKPSNVLLREDTSDAAGDEARWNVLLTDPASDSELETDGKHVEDDLHQIGRMLYQLVEGKEWPATAKPDGHDSDELPLSNAWKRLGSIGEPMHILCGELLSANPPALGEVESRLEAMVSRRGGMPMKPLIASAAAVIVLAVGGWFAFAAITSKPTEVAVNDGSQGRQVAPPTGGPEPPPPRDGAMADEAARQKFNAVKANWLDDLIGNPPAVPFSVLQSIGGDDDLRRSIAHMSRLDPERAGGYDNAMLLVDGLRENLQSTLVDPVRHQAALWDGVMQWSTAAQELRGIAADMRSLLEANEPIEPADGGAFVDQVRRIDTVLRKREMEDDWDRLLRRVDEVAGAIAQHELGDDPIMRRMEESIELEFGAASIDDLHDLLAGWNDAVDSLDLAMARVANVDMAYMRESSAAYERADNPEGLRRQHFAAWVEAVEGGRYDIPRDDPRDEEQLVAELADKWRELREVRAQFHPEACPDIEQPAGRGTEQLQEQLDAVAWEPTHATRNRILDHIESLRSALRREIADWNQVVLTCQLGCEEELTMLLERDLPMDELPAAAQQLLEPALQQWSEVRTGEHLPCEQRRNAARHLSQFFHRASEHLFSPGPVPGDIPATITPQSAEAFFRQKWDELVGPKLRVARDADWQEGIARDDPLWRGLDEARTEYEQWRQTAAQLLADYRDIEQWLNLAFGWEQVRDRYQPGGNPWPQRPIYEDLSRPLEEIARITSDVEKLRAMEQRQVAGIADAQHLVAEIAREVETPAYRWAAWRRLADAATFRNFLDWEDEVATHVESMLSEIERVRYRTLENTWRIGRRERWVANAAAADDRRWMHEAFDRMEDFGITDPAADITDPRVRFNYDLKKLRERVQAFIALEEHDEAGRRQIQQSARDLVQRIDTFDAPESERQAWHELLADIAEFDVDEDVDTGPAWSQMGPARAGWEWELIEDGAVVRYFPPAEWRKQYAPLLGELAQDGAALKFRRIIVGDGSEDDASYISTAEISAGLFMAIAKHADAESLLRRELLGDGSSGARVWEWRGGEMSPVREMWMGFQRPVENDLPPPSPQYPVQNLTPAAAVYVAGLLGCRLPTEREWREAVAVAIRDRGTIRAHLLGSRLSDLIARVAAYNEGRFEREHEPNHHSLPQVLRMELGRIENNDSSDPLIGNIEPVDAAWFQPVDVTSREFQHLLGNVAEFIFTDAIDFERFAELPDAAEQPQAFLDELRAILVPGDQGDDAAIRVIGGSIFFAMNEHPILRALPYAQSRRIPTRLHQQSYSDVGFRLAFDSTARLSGEERFRQLVKTVLDEQEREPFLLARRR